MTGRRVLGLAIVAVALGGCAGGEQVVRVIDGRPVAGEFVPADAYAAYLRASIADASGDLPAAIEGYMIAAALGPRDPEPWARLGDARCRRDAKDPRADDALSRALAIDGSYAPALEVRAHCAERRGELKVAVESARRAAKADANAVEPLATLARLQPTNGDTAVSEDLRARLMAMTLVEGTNAAAWDALATWARGHGDALLEARALGAVASLVDARRAEVDAAVLRLVGNGEISAARSLARARVGSNALEGEIDPRVARLAIDDAIISGDVESARRMAIRSHVPQVVVAARALLLGDAPMARSLGATLLDAEPSALAVRLLVAAAGGGPGEAVGRGGAKSRPVPAEVWMAHGRVLAREGSAAAARSFLLAIPRESIVPGDPLTTSVAVALAAAGVLEASDLDANGRIELAERRAELAPDDQLAAADARHRLLALARRAPRDPKTAALARTLAPVRGRDPIVGVAFARLTLAGAGDALSAGAALAPLDPSDPLVASAALDCALRAGDARTIPLARARLAAVAHTPAERARVLE